MTSPENNGIESVPAEQPRRPPSTKTRSYNYDTRHLIPMVRDFGTLFTGLVRKRQISHLVHLGRQVRQQAFDLRDPLPMIDHPELAQFLGCIDPPPIKLPPIDVISLSGLGFLHPYAMFATITSAVAPTKIFEIGTFRGVASLTFAMNAPQAQVYTLDLPPDSGGGEQDTLSRGDKEWVRLSRSSVGFAFHGRPEQERIHQIYGDSLNFTPPAVLYGSDLCFIDAGHSYECVRADTRTALSVIRPGGVLLWDDYTWFADGVNQYLGTELRKVLPLHRITGTQLVLCKMTEENIAAALSLK